MGRSTKAFVSEELVSARLAGFLLSFAVGLSRVSPKRISVGESIETEGRFHALRRMRVTHIGAKRTRQ